MSQASTPTTAAAARVPAPIEAQGA
ncbi:taurine ABC transporter permease: TauT family protein, partial [Cupriavidus sp. HMR-1]